MLTWISILQKCAFFQTKVQFLGHIVSKYGLQVDPEKVDVVKKFPIPKNQTEVKSFLGLASYYRRYVSNFAAVARPFHKVSETSSVFSWTEEAQDAFDTLKTSLTWTPILASPCLQQPSILYTDAMSVSIGSRPRSKTKWYGKSHLLRFQSTFEVAHKIFSNSLRTPWHRNFYQTFPSLPVGTEVYDRNWPWGTPMATQVQRTGRDDRPLVRKIASFDYTVRHRPGTSIGHADGLSGVPSHEVKVVPQNSSGIECPHQDESNQMEHSTMIQNNDDDHASTSSQEWPNRKIPQKS